MIYGKRGGTARAVVIAFNYRRTITKTRRNLETARKKTER